ncbi:hypothetical protein H2200_002702 [Cladophialophora chaetospira]|uniref:Uncharacterized protein n=1 Tax=Cladophialophora chaetospira TaxID=386627 RepID=A0AA38XJC3_9EURO|nr:hypothetical protein H2200_002702 [Cladophialophora chaetospira]
MPIPVRSQSPIKANSAASALSSTSTKSGDVPQTEARGTKELTRLLRQPASDRATSSISARGVNDSKPRDPGPATKVGSSAHNFRGSFHPSASDSSATRAGPTVSERAVGAEFTRSQNTTASNAGDVRGIASTSHTRALSASTRPRGTLETRRLREAGSRPTVSAPSPAALPTVSRTPLLRSAISPTLSTTKPKFNTYQQRFSPKKPINASLPSASASDQASVRPGSAGRVIPSKEVDRDLLDELMQLTLVQEGSVNTLHTYERSIKLQLRTNHEHVENQLSLLISMQHDRQVAINALAMTSWLDGDSQTQDALSTGSDTLLLLAHSLKELQVVTEENGPLENSIKIFEEWCAYTSSRRSNRDGSNNEDQGYFLQPGSSTAPQWAALVSSVEDRMKTSAASLADLRRQREDSSIDVLIKMHTTLAEVILQEIRLLRAIEGLIVREERKWVETAVDAALRHAELHHLASAARASARQGIWASKEAVRSSS